MNRVRIGCQSTCAPERLTSSDHLRDFGAPELDEFLGLHAAGLEPLAGQLGLHLGRRQRAWPRRRAAAPRTGAGVAAGA